MSNEMDWTKRVEAATAGTMHEQLRTLAQEARESMAAIAAVVRDQGSLIEQVGERAAAAQAETEAVLERMNREMADERRRVIEERSAGRDDRHDAIASANASFVAEFKRLTDGFNDSLEIVRAEIESCSARAMARVDERADDLRAAVERTVSTLAEQLEAETDRLHAELAAAIDAMSKRVADLEAFRPAPVAPPASPADEDMTVVFG